MKKFKITIQRKWFGGDEIINESNRTNSIEIECDSFSENRDEIEITIDNIEYARKHIDSEYKIGDIHISPLVSISFIKGGEEIEKINVLADPYYKLEEFINDQWIMLDKHKCLNHNWNL